MPAYLHVTTDRDRLLATDYVVLTYLQMKTL
jgi:hypothetical protein